MESPRVVKDNSRIILTRMVQYLPLLSLSFLIMVVCGACGGGGSSDGGTKGIRVLHASIEAAPVDVFSSAADEPLISQVFFGGSISYENISAVPQTISITRAFTPSRIVASFDIDGALVERSSLLLYGDLSSLGLRATIIEDDVPGRVEESVLKFVHGLVGASAIVVSGHVDGRLLFEELIEFGGASAYVNVPMEQAVQLVIYRAVDGRLIESPSFAFEKGKAYTALVTGEVGYYTKTVLYNDN
jgi:hypothetical protein